MFAFKKILSSLLMPFSIGLFLILLGIIFLFKRKIQKAKAFLIIGIIWTMIISHSSFANLLLAPLENSYPKLQSVPEHAKYIVFLGGDMENRGWEVLKQYNKIHGAKIITSGYEGRGSTPEAIRTAAIIKDAGIIGEDILIYPKPKDTREEAKNIKNILRNERFVLVTSAYHMQRAMIIFESEGMKPIPAPTDFLIKDSDTAISLPDGYSLQKTEKAWHEYLGIFWAKIVNLLVD